MREWLAYGIGGLCTAIGVIEAAYGTAAAASTWLGAVVLVLIFALSYSNEKLWQS